MRKKVYEVVVEVSDDSTDKHRAIAEASRYLAYADQSDTFNPMDSDLYGVDVNGGTVDGSAEYDWRIGLTFAATLPSDDDVKRFMDEMASLSRVKTVEELRYVEQ